MPRRGPGEAAPSQRVPPPSRPSPLPGLPPFPAFPFPAFPPSEWGEGAEKQETGDARRSTGGHEKAIALGRSVVSRDRCHHVEARVCARHACCADRRRGAAVVCTARPTVGGLEVSPSTDHRRLRRRLLLRVPVVGHRGRRRGTRWAQGGRRSPRRGSGSPRRPRSQSGKRRRDWPAPFGAEGAGSTLRCNRTRSPPIRRPFPPFRWGEGRDGGKVRMRRSHATMPRSRAAIERPEKTAMRTVHRRARCVVLHAHQRGGASNAATNSRCTCRLASDASCAGR